MFVVFAVLVGLDPGNSCCCLCASEWKDESCKSTFPFGDWVQCLQLSDWHDGGGPGTCLAGIAIFGAGGWHGTNRQC